MNRVVITISGPAAVDLSVIAEEVKAAMLNRGANAPVGRITVIDAADMNGWHQPNSCEVVVQTLRVMPFAKTPTKETP